MILAQMNRLLVSLAMLAIFGAPVRGAAANDDGQTQIRALEAAFAKAYSNKDVTSLMAVYAPGRSLFVFDVVGPPGEYSSWDQYRDAWTHFFAMFQGSLQFAISDLSVVTSGNVGFSRSLQHVLGTRADGKAYDITVRVTDVYEKFGDKWLIVQEHVSLPINRKTFAPMLNSAP